MNYLLFILLLVNIWIFVYFIITRPYMRYLKEKYDTKSELSRKKPAAISDFLGPSPLSFELTILLATVIAFPLYLLITKMIF